MTIVADQTLPAIAVISSHVVRGSVGNRAIVFALETLGFPIWAVPTITLPWHPGHGPAPRIVADDQQFCDMMGSLAASPYLGEIGAVLTGYLGSPAQAAAVAGFIAAVKKVNSAAVHLCDPVIGDSGGLYVPEAVACEIRDRLYCEADIVTPNRYEFEWLSGSGVDTNEDIIRAAADHSARHVIVTSAHSLLAGGIGNLMISERQSVLAEHREIDNAPSGTGDLLSALILGRMVSGQTPEKALQLATASVYELVARACRRGADEIMLETDSESMKRPMAMVQMRQIAMKPSPPQRA
jgi:pyridoxine kinase